MIHSRRQTPIFKSGYKAPLSALLGKMLAELGRSHLAIFPPHVVWNPKSGPEARVTPAGIVLGVADQRIVFVSVAPDSPAGAAGICPDESRRCAVPEGGSDNCPPGGRKEV